MAKRLEVPKRPTDANGGDFDAEVDKAVAQLEPKLESIAAGIAEELRQLERLVVDYERARSTAFVRRDPIRPR